MITITQQSSTNTYVAAYVERLINSDSDAKVFLQNPGEELQKLGFSFDGCAEETPSFDEILISCKHGFRTALSVDVGATIIVGVGVVVDVAVESGN